MTNELINEIKDEEGGGNEAENKKGIDNYVVTELQCLRVKQSISQQSKQ